MMEMFNITVSKTGRCKLAPCTWATVLSLAKPAPGLLSNKDPAVDGISDFPTFNTLIFLYFK